MNIGLPELLIVLFILLLIAGPKRISGLGAPLGRGLREFKDGITGRDANEDVRSLERPADPS